MLADEQAEQRKLTEAQGAGRRAPRADLRAELREGRRPVAAAGEVGAVAARSDSGRRAHEHAHHHGPARSAADRGRADRRRSTGRSRRSKSKRASSRPRATSRARSASSGASTAASTRRSATRPAWRFPNNGSLGGRVGGTQARTGFTQGPTDPRGGTESEHGDGRQPRAPPAATSGDRPGARLDQRRVQPRRRADGAREHAARGASCRRRA